jgi:hypothetical protein
MLNSAELILLIEYLREYEQIFETALPFETGGPGIVRQTTKEGRIS